MEDDSSSQLQVTMGFKAADRTGIRQRAARVTAHQIAGLGRNVVELRDEIRALEDEIRALRSTERELRSEIRLLGLCKVDDPRYPYWGWMLRRARAEHDRQLSTVLGRLDDRVTGSQGRTEDHEAVDGVPREVLLRRGSPSVAEVFSTIKTVLDLTQDHDCVELLRALHGQGMFRPLCEHVLAQIDESAGIRDVGGGPERRDERRDEDAPPSAT